MDTLSVLYFVEPMMGLGSHYWAQVLAKAIVETHADIELTILIEDLVPLSITHERINWVKLPICRNQVSEDGSVTFKLIDENGKEVDEEWKKNRVDIVRSTFHQVKPNVVLLHNHLSGLEWDKLIEFEYKALVELAQASPWNPTILASAMDFIDGFEDGSDVVAQEYLHKVQEEVDYILVCGESLDLFTRSCPPAKHFMDKLILAGYPVDQTLAAPLASPPPSPEVLVAAGGGELGEPLFRAAIEAFRLAYQRQSLTLSNCSWRLLVGPNLKNRLPALREMADEVATSVGAEGKIIVQPTVSSSEYLARLTYHCVASVSQCGQSTFVDLEKSGVPALVVPYEANGIVQEQVYRAEFLQETGRGVMLREHNLTANSLLIGLEKALAIGPKKIGVNSNGADFIANFIHASALRNRQMSQSISKEKLPNSQLQVLTSIG